MNRERILQAIALIVTLWALTMGVLAAVADQGPCLNPIFERTKLPVLYLCLQGPGIQITRSPCDGLDCDGDNDIDLADFAAMQRGAITDIPRHWWFRWNPPVRWREYQRYRFGMYRRGQFELVMLGPCVPAPCKARMCYDLDGDGDVDLRDLAAYQVEVFSLRGTASRGDGIR